jgi:hypothetical protein
MNSRIAAILYEMRRLDDELEMEFARKRLEFAFTVRDRAVRFEEHVLKRHKELKSRLSRYVLGARPLFVITSPVIYSLIVPLVLLDVLVWLYQWVCFPVYGIARVRRRDYLILDRHQLAYLNAIEKINCAYCSYATGLISYVREVTSRTEQYWCPIKHARRIVGMHERYAKYSDYGDAESYHKELVALREQLNRERSGEG